MTIHKLSLSHIASSLRANPFVWGIGILGLLLDLSSFVLILLTPNAPVALGWGPRGFSMVLSLPSIIFGMLILRRHPQHLIAAMLCFVGFASGLQSFLIEYSLRALFVIPGSLPLGLFAAWIVNWIWIPLSSLISGIFFLFPNGKLLSPRWRWGVVYALSVMCFFVLVTMFSPDVMTSSLGKLPNPYGLQNLTSVFEVAFILSYVGWMSVFVLSALSLLLRFLRSRGVERQQLKWLLYAGALLALVAPFGGSESIWLQLPLVFAYAFILVAIAIAILRYRLFDIDILIRRTLTYALVTALLVIVFFGSIIFLQNLFATLIGSRQNELVTVISTLAIAALFVPMRNRIQNEIDKRFNRKKYNAQQVMSDFANTVRDETDLEKLTGRLIQVVDETMQPKTVSVWLKKEQE